MRWLCFFGVHELEDKDRFSNLLDDTWIRNVNTVIAIQHIVTA